MCQQADSSSVRITAVLLGFLSTAAWHALCNMVPRKSSAVFENLITPHSPLGTAGTLSAVLGEYASEYYETSVLSSHGSGHGRG